MKNLVLSLMTFTVLAGIVGGFESFAQPAPPPIIHGTVTAPPVQAMPPLLPPPSLPGLTGLITFDAERKEVTVPNGTPQAQFTFNLTNTSPEVVTISGVTTSCGCTVAKLPETPWKIAPGAGGQISATMNLAGKSGTSQKTLTVNSDKGPKLLIVQATILPADAAAKPMTPMDREANQKLAIADRQGVFKGDCARCHVQPTKGLVGQPLFVKACGICHEAEHRATMVADLHNLPYETNAELWKNWIVHGKPGGLMPAFALSEGGILSDEQITSLVNYLVVAIPAKHASVTK
jgi:mono/diheme cytochrome c family protein